MSPAESKALLARPAAPQGHCPCADAALCEPVRALRFERELFVFHTAGEPCNYDQWRQFDWSRITTLAVWEFGIRPELLCYAHSLGVKVVLPASLPTKVYAGADAAAKDAWVAATVKAVRSAFADGVNFDTEDAIDGQDAQTRAGLTDIVARTRAALPDLQITFDVGAWPGVDDRFYDFSALAAATDFFVVMAYDMASAVWGACLASPNSPPPMVNQGILNWLAVAGVAPSSLVLALPWYGRSYACADGTAPGARYCPIEPSPWRSAPCTDATADAVAFSAVPAMLKRSVGAFAGAAGAGRPSLDAVLESRYFNVPGKAGEAGPPTQVWFDDVASLRGKYRNAIATHGLRGIGCWTANMLDYGPAPFNDTSLIPSATHEMWAAISNATTLNATTLATPRPSGAAA